MNSGAVHNFIDTLIASCLDLKLVGVGSFEVIVVDREKLDGRACCKAIMLSI